MRTTQSESGAVPESDIARRNAERRLFGSLGTQSDRIRQEMQRYASMRDPTLRAKMKHNLNPVMNAQLDRNRRQGRHIGHRRNMSDPRFSTSLTDGYGEEEMGQFGRPVSSLGYRDEYFADTLGMDNSRSYLGGSRLSGTASLSGLDGGLHSGLRDTAMYGNTGYDVQSDDRNRYLASRSQQLLRRFSDEGLANLDNPGMRNFDGSSPISARRAHSSMSGHQRVSGHHLNPTYGMRHPSMGPSSRSWHPSPFASDDEIAATDEPQFYKEEKKNKIKMEIARRRHQIDENACLHEELSRLAKLREHAEFSNRLDVPHSTNLVSNLTGTVGGVYGINPNMHGINQFGNAISPSVMAAAASGHASVSNFNMHSNPNYLNASSQLGHTATHHGTGAAGSHLIPTSGIDGTSVLKSVDEILRETGVNPGMTGGLPSANTLLTNHPHMNPSAYSNLTNNYATIRSNQNALTSLHNHVPTGVDPYSGVGVGATPTMSGYAHRPVTSSYDRVTDFSPINSEIHDLNPMMNDMTISGNRSNRMLQRGAYGQPNIGI